MPEQTKYLLSESEIPRAWYNINADMPVDPAEPAWNTALDPITQVPLPPNCLGPFFTKAFAELEVSTERWVDIPDPVIDAYKLWRPTPLIRAIRLEKALDTPAHIYFKYEGVSPVGSHKPNTAVPQAFYASDEGATGLITFTGAGQWGSALAMASQFFGLECHVYMVRVSYHQKPYRRILMESFGASVSPSPSDSTEYGRRLLAEDPDHPGSLGIANTEVTEVAEQFGETFKYGSGSFFGAVLTHQTVIGLEALKQFELAGEYPDVLVACNGAGSNFAGFVFPFLHQNFTRGTKTRAIAVEPMSCPSLTKGKYTFDCADADYRSPLMKMHTLGHTFLPPNVHAGGLRYHGSAPHISALYDHGDIEAVAVHQLATFDAALQFHRTEGILPAPESAHAIRTTIDEALRCKETGEAKVIAFNLSGHGHYDLAAYDAYLKNELEDYEYPDEAVREALNHVPEVGNASI